MNRTRIRWSSLGRLVAGLGAGGLVIAVVPGLLERPEAPPLPADVGLAQGTSGATGVVSEPPPLDHRRHREVTRGRRDDRADRSAERAGAAERQRQRAGSDRRPDDRSATAPPPPADPPPVAASVPTPPAPPPPPPPPEQPDDTEDGGGEGRGSPPPADPVPPTPDPDPATPSQFGFEH